MKKKQLYAIIFLILFIISFTEVFTSYGIKNGKLNYKIYSTDKEYNIEVWQTSKLYSSILFASREPSFIKLYKKRPHFYTATSVGVGNGSGLPKKCGSFSMNNSHNIRKRANTSRSLTMVYTSGSGAAKQMALML